MLRYSLTEVARKKRCDLILPRLKRGWKILDLGCGSGWFVEKLRNMGHDCVGVDVRLQQKRPPRYLLEASVEKRLPFPSDHFDCIVSMEVLEHVEPRSYNEIKRVLKRGGLLIVTTPYPSAEPFLQVMRHMKLIRWVTADSAQHINPIVVENMPFDLVEKKRILLFDQYAVFKNKK